MKKEFVTDGKKVKADELGERAIPKETQEKVANDNGGITEIVFILDKSGSMAGMEEDAIGGFNSMIERQKAEDGKAYVSTILFSTRSLVLHDRKDLKEITPLTKKEYAVGGCTALLDAIGGAIRHIGNVHKYARKEDVPQKTIFVITTDGMENASREFSSAKVKEMIERKKEERGWEFLFVAANIDAVETAETIGIKRDRAVNYNVEYGTGAMYSEIDLAVRDYRKSGKIKKDWAETFEKAQSEAITPKTAQTPDKNN